MPCHPAEVKGKSYLAATTPYNRYDWTAGENAMAPSGMTYRLELLDLSGTGSEGRERLAGVGSCSIWPAPGANGL